MKTKKYLSILLCAALLIGLLAGCGAKSASGDYGVAYDSAVEAPAAMEEMESNYKLTESGSDASAVLPESRKWIITVNMDAETEDLDALLASLSKKIASLSGYVESQRVYNGSSYSSRRYRSASLTVRIPAERVDDFTEEVSGLSNVVSNYKELEDVTLSYVATESRMKALQTEEERLLELMEQAETMSDLLEIEERLTDVRYELESVTSQLRTYDNLVNYATVYLNIDEVQEYTPVQERTLWERISQGFVASLRGLWNGIVEAMAWVIINLPYLVVVGAVILVIVVLLRRRKNRRAAKRTEPENKQDQT